MGGWPGEVETSLDFGARLLTIRTRLGLTQLQLAGLAEVHRTFIQRLESGRSNPTLRTIVRLAWALGVDTCELVGGMRPPIDHPTRPAPT